MINVRDITVARGRRDAGDVTELAESIDKLGVLLQPLVVSPKLRLIAGGRRLAAVRKLGWKTVPATVVRLADLEAELAEIDENLIREELTVLERGEQLRRRKEIYEALHPEAKKPKGGRPRNGEIISAFSTDAAAKAGVSPRTVRHEVQIADKLHEKAKQIVRATPLADNKSELLRLARVEPARQAATARAIVRGQASTVSQAVRVVDRAQKTRATARRAAASPGANGHAEDWSIITGDSVVELPRLRAAGRRFRLIFADPPYNQGVDYGRGAKADRLSPAAYLDWCGRWMQGCADLLTDDGSLWVLISDEYAAEYAIRLKETGLQRRQWIIWYETFGVNASDKFNRCHRHLFWMVRDERRCVFNAEAVNRPSDRQVKYDDSRADPNGKNWDDVWGVEVKDKVGRVVVPKIPRLVENAAERLPGFPTQLPLALLRPIVGVASDPGDDVLDPFNGSATTGAACLELGRRYTGIEAEKANADRARLRLRAMAGELRASA